MRSESEIKASLPSIMHTAKPQAPRLNEPCHSPEIGHSRHARRIGGGCSGRLTAPSELHHLPKQAPNRARIRHPRGVGLACSLDNILSINGLVQQPAPAPISSSTAPRERPWLGQGLTSVVAPAPIFQVRPAAKGGGRRFPGRRSVSEANLRVAYRHIPWGGQSGPTEYSWQAEEVKVG